MLAFTLHSSAESDPSQPPQVQYIQKLRERAFLYNETFINTLRETIDENTTAAEEAFIRERIDILEQIHNIEDRLGRENADDVEADAKTLFEIVDLYDRLDDQALPNDERDSIEKELDLKKKEIASPTSLPTHAPTTGGADGTNAIANDDANG